MTSTQTASLAALAVALFLLFMLVIVGIPRLARLLFRYRLEVLRDECMDAILDDRLREVGPVRRFLRAVEASAAVPHLLTMPRLLAITQALMDAGVDLRALAPPPGYADLRPDERGIMDQLDARLSDAYRSYLDWGSPAVWVRRPCLWLVGWIRPASNIVRARAVLPAVARETLQDSTAKTRRAVLPGHLFASR